MEDRLWYLKKCPLFEQLDSRDIAALESVSIHKKLPKRTLIYMPADSGESVFLLTSGRIKLYHITGDGKHAVLALLEPGEIFGELSLLDHGPREEFAETMEASTLIRIPKDVMQRLMEENARLTMGITRLIGMRRQRIERRLKSLLFTSNRERLTDLLVDLADQYGVREAGGVRIGIKLSHQDLASIIGSTRETVTVVLGEMQKEGVVQLQRRTIVIKNIERLKDSSTGLPIDREVLRPVVSGGRR